MRTVKICCYFLCGMVCLLRPDWLRSQATPLRWEACYSNTDIVSSVYTISGGKFGCDILTAMDGQTNIFIAGRVPLWYEKSDGKEYPRRHKSVKLDVNKVFTETTYGITYGPLQKKMITDHVYDYGTIEMSAPRVHSAIFVTKSGPNGWTITIDPPHDSYGKYMNVRPLKLVMDAAGDIYV